MVESGLLPIDWRMAGGAVRAIAALVRIILGVAVKAAGNRVLQIFGRARPGVAVLAWQGAVLAFQREEIPVMVEFAAVAINAIVAGQAAFCKNCTVCLYVFSIDLRMAIGADGDVKLGKIIVVTVAAGEIVTTGSFAVRLQRISQ